MIVVVVLVLILTTTIGVIVIGRLIHYRTVFTNKPLNILYIYYRRYYRHTIRVREERIEDAQDDVS